MTNQSNIKIRASFTSRFSLPNAVFNGVRKEDYKDMLLYGLHAEEIQVNGPEVTGDNVVHQELIKGVQIDYIKNGIHRHIKKDITHGVFSIESVGQVHIRRGRTFGVVRGVLSGSTVDFYSINRPEPEIDKIKKKRAGHHKKTYNKAVNEKENQFNSLNILGNFMGVLVLIFFGFKSSNSGQSVTSSILFLLAGLGVLLNAKVLSPSLLTNLKSKVSSALGVLVVVGLIVGAISFFGRSSVKRYEQNEFSNVKDTDWLTYSSMIDSVDENIVFSDEIDVPSNACELTENVLVQNIELFDENFKPFRLTYSTSIIKACSAKNFRENLKIYEAEEEAYFKMLYKDLIQNDETSLNNLLSTYELVRKDRDLDYEEFCDFIVKSIQYIPYSLVTNEPCSDCSSHGNYSCGNNCVPNTRFGIFGPSEFAFSKQGDCDTRTVLLLLILKHFEYDAVILNCNDHSMLGVNIPAFTGEYFTYLNKDYYYWETTATGWEAGMIPPNSQYKTWYVALSTDEL